MLSVFFIWGFLRLVRCLCRYLAVLLFLGSLFEKFSGANFCFWVSLLVLCFLVGFCLCFCFMFWRIAPESVWKNSLDVRSCFLGFVLSYFGFFVDTVFCLFLFLFKRYSSGSNRTPPHALVFLVLVLFLRPAAPVVSPLFGRASCFLAFSSGCHSGPRAFLGFSWNLRGLCSLAPSEAFLDARRHGFFLASCPWFLFFPLCFVLRPHFF